MANMKIKSKVHAEQQIKSFKGFLKNGKFSDCILVADDGIINAHKVILAANSTYFQEFFSQFNRSACLVDNICYHDLNNIVNYLYDGEIIIKIEDMKQFIKVGEMLGIKGIYNFEVDIIKESPPLVENEPIIEANNDTMLVEQLLEKEPITVDSEEILLVDIGSFENSDTCSVTYEDMMPGTSSSTQHQQLKDKNENTMDSKKLELETVNEIEPSSSNQIHTCSFCMKRFSSCYTRNTHENYNCKSNPNRKLYTCKICNQKIKIGSSTAHKRKYHGHNPFAKNRRMTTFD